MSEPIDSTVIGVFGAFGAAVRVRLAHGLADAPARPVRVGDRVRARELRVRPDGQREYVILEPAP